MRRKICFESCGASSDAARATRHYSATPPAKNGADEEERRDYTEVERERAWGLRAFESLRSYFQLEDPRRFEPLGCEERVTAQISAAVEAYAPITVTGTIDRLDDTAHGPVVVDYKTGRSPPVRFRDRSTLFFQLEVYALLLRASGRWKNPDSTTVTLRLIFLGDGQVLEKTVSQHEVDETEQQLRDAYADMLVAFRTGNFNGCGRRSCSACGAEASVPLEETQTPHADISREL